MKLPLLTMLALSGLATGSIAQSLRPADLLPAPATNNAARSSQTNGLRLAVILEQSFRNNAWKDTLRQTNSSFTSADLPARILREQSLNGSTWTALRRIHRRYTAANDVLNDTTFTFSTAGVATARIAVANTYTPAGKPSQSLSRTRFGAAWENYGRDTYTYDAQNNLTRLLLEGSLGSGYYESSQTLFTNDAQGRKIVEEVQQASSNGGWVPFAKDVYTYTTSGQVNVLTSQVVPSNSTVYQNFRRESYSYDAVVPTRLTKTVVETWRNNAWAEVAQNTFAYDAGGNVTSIVTQVLVAPNTYRNYYRVTYAYQTTTATATKNFNAELSVFPNPAAGPATAQYRLPATATVSVDVFDALGRRVAAPLAEQAQAAGEQSVALPASLKAGLYTVRVRTADGRSQQSKLVVE